MFPFRIEKIYIDEKAQKDFVTQRVLNALPYIPAEMFQEKKSIIKRALSTSNPLKNGKRNILITHFYGRRLKPCPGTSNHICCGYYVINTITNCPMDCSYCVLQGYLNNPFLTLYSNWDDLISEIELFLSQKDYSVIRMGTGELSDSLALEPIFPISQFLVPFFAERKDSILELKTKSAEVNQILNLNHCGRTVISWSLNPHSLIEAEEIGTSSLEERIEAARKCQERYYPLGFHFDPIIHYEGWENDYKQTISFLFSRIDPKRVIWVSLGGFRYPPGLKPIVKERFPKTRIFLGELFPGKDDKYRYLKEIRVEMYRKIKGWLRDIDPDLFVYLCMESKEVWEEVYGWAPENSSHLNRLFEERVRQFVE